jgi:TrmH family RNA methyltransferase
MSDTTHMSDGTDTDEVAEVPNASDPLRRQLSEAAALMDALEREAPLRLVLRRDGPVSELASDAFDRAARRGVEVRVVSQRQLTRLCNGSGEPELLALVGADPKRSLPDVLRDAQVAWMLVGTAYPGNAGFVIRTAEVSGADAVVIDSSFDHEERRSVRRTAMRADRYLPLFYESAKTTVEAARAGGLRVVGIEDSGDAAPWELDLLPPSLFVVGGERHGIPPELLADCDHTLRLPMAGFIPSYNLQAAMAMVVGERMRQAAVAGRGASV